MAVQYRHIMMLRKVSRGIHKSGQSPAVSWDPMMGHRNKKVEHCQWILVALALFGSDWCWILIGAIMMVGVAIVFRFLLFARHCLTFWILIIYIICLKLSRWPRISLPMQMDILSPQMWCACRLPAPQFKNIQFCAFHALNCEHVRACSARGELQEP